MDCRWQFIRQSRRDTSLRAPLRQQRLSRGPGGGIPSSTLEEKAPRLLRCGAFSLLAWRDSKPRQPQVVVGEDWVNSKKWGWPADGSSSGRADGRCPIGHLASARLSRGPGGGIPSSTLRGFFSNEENAQNFLYATAIISFSCKHDVCVNFAQNQPKIGLFFTRFPGLGTPRDSCGFYLHEAPLKGVEPRSTP